METGEIFLLLIIYSLGHNVSAETIPCGYMTCNSTFQTCRGTTNDYKRCEKCSDFITDVEKDCFGPIGKECFEYCIGMLNTLLDKERLKVKQKDATLQQSYKNISTCILQKTMKTGQMKAENKTNEILKEPEKEKTNVIPLKITTGVFGGLFCVFLLLYCYEKWKQGKQKSNKNIDENSGVNKQEQDRLRQVKPKQENKTDKVVPSGHKSTRDLSKLKKEEEESFLKTL